MKWYDERQLNCYVQINVFFLLDLCVIEKFVKETLARITELEQESSSR